MLQNVKEGKVGILQFTLLVMMCLPAALAAVTLYKPHMMVTFMFCGLTAGLFLLKHPQLFFWGIVFTAPVTDHLAINLGPFNVRPYNLLAAGGAIWFLFRFLMKDRNNPVIKKAIKGIPWFLPLAALGVIKLLGALNSGQTGLDIPLKFPLKFLILANLTYLSCFIVYSIP